jgi:hypothetical protein
MRSNAPPPLEVIVLLLTNQPKPLSKAMEV